MQEIIEEDLSPDKKDNIEENVEKNMIDNGILIIGESETIRNINQKFKYAK
jgi:chemotaxis methyl-accepting protein methylase